MRNYPAFAPYEPRPNPNYERNEEKLLIRKRLNSIPESIYCVVPYNDIKMFVSSARRQFGNIIFTTRQRRATTHHKLCKPFHFETQLEYLSWHLEYLEGLIPIPYKRKKSIPQMFKAIKARVDFQTRRAVRSLTWIRGSVSEILEDESKKMASVSRQLHSELVRTLRPVWFRAHLIAATNNSAVNTYLLHTFLKWELTAMISSRQELSPLNSNLGTRIRRLRTFNGNLFMRFRIPRFGFIKEQLDYLETQKPLVFADPNPGFHTSQQFRNTDPLIIWEKIRRPRLMYKKVGGPRARGDLARFPTSAYTSEPEHKLDPIIRFTIKGSERTTTWKRGAVEQDNRVFRTSQFRTRTRSGIIQPPQEWKSTLQDHVVGDNRGDTRDVDERFRVKKFSLDDSFEREKVSNIGFAKPNPSTENERKFVENSTKRKRAAKRGLLEAVGRWLGEN